MSSSHTDDQIARIIADLRPTPILRINQQPPLAFVHKGSGFVSDGVNATAQFLPSNEAPTALVLTQFGKSFRFEKDPSSSLGTDAT
jgi:hypothetical protein